MFTQVSGDLCPWWGATANPAKRHKNSGCNEQFKGFDSHGWTEVGNVVLEILKKKVRQILSAKQDLSIKRIMHCFGSSCFCLATLYHNWLVYPIFFWIIFGLSTCEINYYAILCHYLRCQCIITRPSPHAMENLHRPNMECQVYPMPWWP